MSIRDNLFNCPNCGAPINVDLCPYCGTAFIDWSCVDERKPNWIKIKLDGKIVLIKAYLYGIQANYRAPELVTLYADDRYYNVVPTSLGEVEIEASLTAVPFRVPGQNKDTLSVVVDLERGDLQEAGSMLHDIQKGE